MKNLKTYLFISVLALSTQDSYGHYFYCKYSSKTDLQKTAVSIVLPFTAPFTTTADFLKYPCLCNATDLTISILELSALVYCGYHFLLKNNEQTGDNLEDSDENTKDTPAENQQS